MISFLFFLKKETTLILLFLFGCLKCGICQLLPYPWQPTYEKVKLKKKKRKCFLIKNNLKMLKKLDIIYKLAILLYSKYHSFPKTVKMGGRKSNSPKSIIQQ